MIGAPMLGTEKWKRTAWQTETLISFIKTQEQAKKKQNLTNTQ